MNGHHFLSYSRKEARDFAVKLHDALSAGSPPIKAWLDGREIRPGEDRDAQVVEAIRNCESLIFIMSHDSVEEESVCENEWARALEYNKLIIPLRLHRDAELPLRLRHRRYIDFTNDFDMALAQLRDHLQWLASPEGQVQTLTYRLQDAKQDLRRAEPKQRERIQDEIQKLQEQLAHLQQAMGRLGREVISINARALSDNYSEVDQLDFTEYAQALADLVLDRNTEKPLTISIDAPWGMGKTTLMHMIERRLETRTPTVWFNAWKYDKEESLWAALALQILSQTRETVGLRRKAELWIKLNRSRLNIRLLLLKFLQSLLSVFVFLIPVVVWTAKW